MAKFLKAWRDENNPPPADGTYLWFKGDTEQNPQAQLFVVRRGLMLAERKNGTWNNLRSDYVVSGNRDFIDIKRVQ
jgi:hypothetical protein